MKIFFVTSYHDGVTKSLQFIEIVLFLSNHIALTVFEIVMLTIILKEHNFTMILVANTSYNSTQLTMLKVILSMCIPKVLLSVFMQENMHNQSKTKIKLYILAGQF